MKKNIEIDIGSLEVEGVDIRNMHLIKTGIEQELTDMIHQNGYPESGISNLSNTLLSSTLNYSPSLSSANVARSIASSIYSGMGKSTGGNNSNNT